MPSNFARAFHPYFLPLVFCVLAATAQAEAKSRPTVTSLDEFTQCLREHHSADACLKALEKFVNSSPKTAMGAARLVRLNFNASVSLKFFEMASKQDVPGFCQDQDLQLAVVHGLGLPADYPDAARARALFSGTCHEPLAGKVLAELAGESRGSYLAANACPILQQRDPLPAVCLPSPETSATAPEEAQLPKIDKGRIELGMVKVYSGPEGERLTMAPIQGGDFYLIRFDGIAGPWNGKALLHKRADRGNDAADFWTEHNGRRWNSVVRRGGMRVFVPGTASQNGFAAGYADKLSQNASAAALLKAYQP